MKTAIMQPTFNPWIGYFDLIDFVDEFIFLDTVQLVKRSWQTRNKLIVDSEGKMFSIPICKTSSRDNLLIKDAKISYDQFNFKEKFYALLLHHYKKSPYFEKTNDFIKELLFFNTDSLSEYNINIIKNISSQIGIKTKFTTLSMSDFSLKSKKADLIFNICKHFHTNTYASPVGSYDYLKNAHDSFQKNNIEIKYQVYHHPIYKQLSKEFIPYVGILDLLYNNGFEKSLEIIKVGRNYENR